MADEPAPGWTIETLREYTSMRGDLLEEQISRRFAAVEAVMVERLDSLERAMRSRIETHGELHRELDLRYEQRFQAQEMAVEMASTALAKEFHEHLVAAREENQAARDASDKAITKSEASTEKRFESVNGFQAQLRTQAATFMPRAESEQRIAANAEKVDALGARFVEAAATINSRLDLQAGRSTGIGDGWGYIAGAAGVAAAFVAIISAVA